MPRATYRREPIQRVVNRIVRGMFYHERAELLGDDHVVDDFVLNPDLEKLDERTLQPIQNTPWHESSDTVFNYRLIPTDEDPRVCFFGMQFYQRTFFLTWTLPRADWTSDSSRDPAGRRGDHHGRGNGVAARQPGHYLPWCADEE